MIERNLSDIKMVIFHKSGSDLKEHDNINTIRKWHLRRGFSDVGYHFFITKDGTLQFGRGLDYVGAHCKGQNTDSVGICISGDQKFKEIQFIAAAQHTVSLAKRIGFSPYSIYPHNFFDEGGKCPGYDIREIYSRILVYDKNKK